MAKVRKRKLKTSELEEVKKRTAGKSELEKAKKVLSKSKSEVDRVAKEIVEIVSEKSTKTKKDKAKSKAKSKAKDKSKSKDKSNKITTKEVKQAVKDLEMPTVLTTREVTKLVEEVTGYSLGQDLTAGAKNLRRYLRSLDQYDDGVNTNYRWSIKDNDDLKELSSILSYYSLKANKLG